MLMQGPRTHTIGGSGITEGSSASIIAAGSVTDPVGFVGTGCGQAKVKQHLPCAAGCRASAHTALCEFEYCADLHQAIFSVAA
jgi:hypothetical protein